MFLLYFYCVHNTVFLYHTIAFFRTKGKPIFLTKG